MLADRAHFGSFLADNYVAAVGALPELIAIAREYKPAVNIGKKFALTLFVLFFDFAHHFE